MSKLTSYDNAVVGSGSIVNDVALTYNAFGQIVSDAQSHSGVVVPGTTPQVRYAYANGSTNTIRPTTLTYPNGRAITIGYGTTGGINDSVSRVDGLIDGATSLVNYAYLGLGVAVQTTYPQPSTQYTLLDSSAGNSPAGDIYWGLDRFGRIIDSRWLNTGTNTDVGRIKYGYDRASNRIWRQNPVATAAGAQFDEFYTNDGLQRLKDMQRGTLNGNNTGITSPTFKQCWTLDATGNWRAFNESTTGSSWTTVQSRTANPVNETTNITNTVGSSWVTPAYDAAGNMTTIPVGKGATAGWAELSTAGWSALNVDDWATLPVSGTTDTYKATYDAWNRLVKISDAGSGQTIQQNQYDARTFRTVIQTYTSGVLSETRHSYFTTGWRCIEERTAASTNAERQFVWGARYIDDLVVRERDTTGGGTLNERLYALQDANWNMSAIVTTGGLVAERQAYTPYGKPLFMSSAYVSRSISSYGWETLYCGYRFDSATQLFSVRFRPYHPVLGSWMQRDPIGYADGPNVYAAWFVPYGVDPLGLEALIFFSTSAAECSDLPQPVMSIVRFSGGASEATLGAAAFVTPDPTLITKVTGAVAVSHGIDTCVAALRELFTGESTPTLTSQCITQGTIFAGASEEFGEMAGSLGDSAIGLLTPGGAGKLSGPSSVANRVSSRLVKNAGTKKGSIGALVVPNGLRPRVFVGRSTTAGGMGIEGMTDEVRELATNFVSKYGHGCVEPQCLSDAERAGASVAGGYFSVRGTASGSLKDACDACEPLLKELGVKSVK